MMPTTRRSTLALILLLLIAGLPLSAVALEVQDGDLLFVTAARTGLSGAIDDATRRDGQPSFDHVALVAYNTDRHVVLHADGEGSRQQPLDAFLDAAQARQRQVVVYRLRPIRRGTIPAAIDQARRMLGRPYNHSYVQDEDSYYCSDFIERAFRSHTVFALQPMNFRNPQTGEISGHWIALYRGMGMDVPQGLPGTNPNDMAASPVLERVGTLE